MCRTSAALAALVLLFTSAARADERQILDRLRSYFAADSGPRRAALAREIAADPAFERARVREWLHASAPFEPLPPGRRSITVPLDTGETRTVVLRIPAGYDPARPWPLIYALHGTGGDGESIIAYLEQVLAARCDEFVIAAPSGYGQHVIDQGGPPSREHLDVLTAVRKAAHIAADRTFVTGYSLGGHTAWTLAVLHADQFAAAIPLAGSLVIADVDEFWPDFIPNLANTHVLCCWGERDLANTSGAAASEHGGIAGMNRRLTRLAQRSNLPVIGHEVAGKDHGGIVPPPPLLENALAKSRVACPRQVRHTFRRLEQAHCYWLEARAWEGPAWTDEPFKGVLRPGEDPRAALHREIRTRLGRLEGTLDGNRVKLSRKHVDQVVVWLGDTPDSGIDWTQPVTLTAGGRKVFDERVAPDLAVCLAEALRTHDFDRLRWAGLLYEGGQKVRRITAD